MAVIFLILGQFKSPAQSDIQGTNLVISDYHQYNSTNDVDSQIDELKIQNGNSEAALVYQQTIEIDLSVSAKSLYKHASQGHLGIRDLAHCFMKDNNFGKAKNYGFFLFNIFQAINHVRDFTTYIKKPSGDSVKSVKWEISSLDNGFDCEFVKLEPLGISKSKNIFMSQNLSGDKKSIQIDITPDTQEGNYRYAIHFKVNDRTYIIDPRLKIQQ